jgi:hypothetical protein
MWLLGGDNVMYSIDDRDVHSLAKKLNTLPLTMYTNVHFNKLLKLWYQCDFPALESRILNHRQRRMKKTSRVAFSVRNENLERAKFKFTVQETINIINDDKRTDEWVQPFQDSAETYLIAFQDAVNRMKKSVQNSKQRVPLGNNPTPKWSILIHNDSSLSWDGVLIHLAQSAEINDKPNADTTPLLPSQIIHLASEVRGCSPTALTKSILDAVAFGIRHDEVLKSLAYNLPIAVVQCNGKYVVFDLHQIDSMEEMLELVCLDACHSPESEDNNRVHMKKPEGQVEDTPTSKSRPRSRKRLEDRYPDIPQIITDFCKQQSYSAHYRRREETFQVGTRLQDVRKHLFKEIPELQNWGLSEDKVHLYFQPPNRRNKNADS